MPEYGYYDSPQVGRLVTYHNKWVDSYHAEEAIGFGLPVKRGTDKDTQVLLWADAINVPVTGISIFRDSRPTGQYEITDQVPVLTEGRIYVTASVAVVAGEAAYVVVNDGAFTNVAANNLRVGTFMSSGAQDTIVILELKLS